MKNGLTKQCIRKFKMILFEKILSRDENVLLLIK